MNGSREFEAERSGGISNTSLPSFVRQWAGLLGGGNRNLDASKEKFFRSLVFSHLSGMKRGSLRLVENGESFYFGRSKPNGTAGTVENTDDCVSSDISAQINIDDPVVYKMITLNGIVGGGEAYLDKLWTSPDLLALIRFFVSNIAELNRMDKERNWGNRAALAMLRRLNRNSVDGARKNISAHYDLGNDFFELFLDSTMMYSSALFENSTMTLQQASVAKLDALCQKLELKPDDHLIEIGTGWGGMALHAAKNYHCKVTTTTLSRRQMEYTKQKVQEAGLSDRITVLSNDYRQLEGTYDKLVSIEMIEAVGHQYFADYFAKCASLLKPNGLMALQAITIPSQRYEQAKNSVDFIQRYIFPGGCLPSLNVIAEHTAKYTDMDIVSITDITKDYALTLSHWRKSFIDNLDRVRALGFDEQFIRMWTYYLCYCEGGFTERVIGVHQVVSAKPDYRVTC